MAIREFPLPGYGFADYLLYVDGNAAGVIEAKKEGVTLTGVETQSDKYTKGLPAGLPGWSNPLPFCVKTAITEQGSKVETGYYVEKQECGTCKTRWEELDDHFAYVPNQLDRDVVTPDQIRTIVRTFRDKLFSEIFPDRSEVPKTLIFAKGRAALEDPFDRMCA